MNFTDSPFEQMMKEAPRPGRGSSGPCAGCRYARECKNQKDAAGRNSVLCLWSRRLRANVARSPDGPGSDP